MTQRLLPAWFTGSRVHGNTRLRLGLLGTDEFDRAAEGFKALGASVFTRHFKSRDEDPWPQGVWPQMVAEADTQEMKIVAYYWHMAETSIAAAHPDWVCRNPDGTPITHDPGDDDDDGEVGFAYLDITGPYGEEVVLPRLLQLAELGVDGLMFDERHLPPKGCWGSALEDAWKAEKGQPEAPGPNDPGYPEFLDFKARRIEDTFVHWRDVVHAAHPDVVFAVSTTTIPALTLREMTTRLVRVADSAKNEYGLALSKALNDGVFEGDPPLVHPPLRHVRQAVGWTALRDSADGRPPRIWVSGVPNDEHARCAAGSLLAFGCIANMDVDERSLLGKQEPAPGKTPLDALRAAFKLGRDVSPHLATAQPLRWAAVHFPERARNAREDVRAAWQEVLWPMVGAFQALSEDGLPVGIVNDFQLQRGELAGYHVLVLPDPGSLTAAQQQAVAAFGASGGIVIENDPAWEWSDPSKQHAAFDAFRALTFQHVTTAPVRVTGGPEGRYAVAYRSDGRLVVAVTNDFDWVQITKRNKPASPVHPAAPPASGVRVSWRKGHGLPQTWGPLPFPRLRAVEVVSRTRLVVQPVPGGYRVDVPDFPFLALVVVARVLRPLGPHELAPDRQDVK
jgi:hypothetical protein